MKDRDILRELRAGGWTLTVRRSGHIRATHPDASGPMWVSMTPSDQRADYRIRTIARRLLQEGRRVTTEGATHA